jgi:hypothetical protein
MSENGLFSAKMLHSAIASKEHNADPDFWPKMWKWEDDLRKKGLEPTKERFDQWLKEKEAERNKKK